MAEARNPSRFTSGNAAGPLRILAVLVAFSLAIACEGTGVPGSQSESATANASDDDRGTSAEDAVIYEASDASMLDEPGGVPDSKAFWSYVDASGGDHIVQGLHNVPASYQLKARNLSNGATRSINIYDAQATVRRSPDKLASSKSPFNPNRLDVTVYSAEWCGACKRARQLLDHEGVDYVLRDIDDDPAAKDKVRMVLGKVRIPLIDINGTYVTGYDRKMIMKLIKG